MKKSFNELLKEVDHIYITEIQKAIDILEKEINNTNFYPWGGITLAKFYIHSGEIDKAKNLNDLTYEIFPNQTALWTQRIKLYRNSDNYYQILASIIDHLILKDIITESWFANDFYELILICPANKLENLISIGKRSGFLDESLGDGLKKILPLAREIIHAAVSNQSFKNLSKWSLVFLGGDELYKISNGCLCINMSPLKLGPISGWEKRLSKPLAIVLSSLLRRNYLIDNGNFSLPSIQEADKYSILFWHLLTVEITQLMKGNLIVYHPPGAKISHGDLWLRVGNVELWALWNYLDDPQSTLENAEISSKLLLDSKMKGTTPKIKNDWWPKINPLENINRLSMNAGWYAGPEYSKASFKDWANRYLNAMRKATLFDTYPQEILKIAALVPAIRRSTSTLVDQNLIPLLFNQNITFVTAFAKEIQLHHDSGSLEALWKDLGIPGKINSLKTLDAPMSIWPYQPDKDWSTTFSKLLSNVCAEIEKGNTKVFLASCGAYGLPLVNAIHEKYGITCLYIGHRMNIYFGILTNAFLTDSFYMKNKDSKYWLKGNLSKKYMEISRIDDGRYVL
jgi:hypothetical protein